MDLLPLYKTTIDQTASMLGKVGAQQLGATTPCADWTVKDLVNHLIGGQFMFGSALAGNPFTGGEAPDFSQGDLVATWRAASDSVTLGMADKALASKSAALPFGPVPGPQAAGIALLEAYVHTWDLARALGTDPTFPADVTGVVHEIAKNAVAAVPKEAGLFAPSVATTSSDAMAQAIAVTGRKP